MIKLILVTFLAAALVLAVARVAVRRRSGTEAVHQSAASRVDLFAIWAAVLIPSSVVLGWHTAGLLVLAPLGIIVLWFAYRSAAPGKTFKGGPGRAPAIYHLVLTATAIWAAVSLAGALGPNPAAQELGSLIQHVIALIVLSLAGVGWLLGAFATPGEPAERPSRVLGVFEALLAAALAACFFALV